MNKKQIITVSLIAALLLGVGVSYASFQKTNSGALLRLQDSLLTLQNKNKSKKTTTAKTTKKSTKKSTKKTKKNNFNVGDTPAVGAIIETVSVYTPSVMKLNGKVIPKDLYNLVKGANIEQTIQSVTGQINATVTKGTKLTNAQTEQFLQELFAQATTDTGNFAADLVSKYNITNLPVSVLRDNQARKQLQQTIKKEMENYAKQELNKLANQTITSFIPQLQGLNINWTNLNEKSVKASLRSMAVNALSQSYLGPQYVAFYLAFETFFPHEAEKVHKELRRFDRNYIQPVTSKIEDEWDRAVNKVKAEAKRVEKKVKAEAKRVKKKLKKIF